MRAGGPVLRDCECSLMPLTSIKMIGSLKLLDLSPSHYKVSQHSQLDSSLHRELAYFSLSGSR